MSEVVTVFVDSAGRLPLPEAIREKAGLHPGDSVELTVTDGHVEMKPAATPKADKEPADAGIPDYSELLQVPDDDDADRWGWDWPGPEQDLVPRLAVSERKP
jgi:AbrB family looped-hinge helix DNA binding protein